MHTPWQALSEYMASRSWNQSLSPLLDEEPDEAKRTARQTLRAADLVTSVEELEKRIVTSDCPIGAIDAQSSTRDNPAELSSVMRACCTIWNHTSREDLGGVTPVEHLRARLEERPQEKPWVVAAEEDDKIAHFLGPDFFQDLPDPSEFGLTELLDLDSDTTRVPRLRSPLHPGRNEPCPCGSGRKYKKCCQDAPKR